MKAKDAFWRSAVEAPYGEHVGKIEADGVDFHAHFLWLGRRQGVLFGFHVGEGAGAEAGGAAED